MINAIAFKNKSKEDRFLSNGPDAGDWSDEDLDVKIDSIEDAFLIVREDRSTPNDDDLKNLVMESRMHKKIMKERFGEDAIISFDVDEWFKHYDPVLISITEEELEASKKWD
ncbi:hypothetical protein [Oceanobacillus kimchii]|uniref:hypothetical protein n=1 Tax=Oceanobacillus kimchii TaxID=746691 RepID=UPI003B02C71F